MDITVTMLLYCRQGLLVPSDAISQVKIVIILNL